jgi:hypothetical protein
VTPEPLRAATDDSIISLVGVITSTGDNVPWLLADSTEQKRPSGGGVPSGSITHANICTRDVRVRGIVYSLLGSLRVFNQQ